MSNTEREGEGLPPIPTPPESGPVGFSSDMVEMLHAHRPRRTNADCDCPTCAWRNRLSLSTRN